MVLLLLYKPLLLLPCALVIISCVLNVIGFFLISSHRFVSPTLTFDTLPLALAESLVICVLSLERYLDHF